MKRFKLLLLTLAISVSTVIFAANSVKIYDLGGLSAEVEHLLRDSDRSVEEGSSVTIFFSVSEDNTIQYVTVAASNEEVADMLQKKLTNHRLDGPDWREGMIYELSVESPAPVACIHKRRR